MAYYGDTLYAYNATTHQIVLFQAPEPASLALLACGAPLLLRRRAKVAGTLHVPSPASALSVPSVI